MEENQSKYFEIGTVESSADDPSQVIPLLQMVQEKKGYVPEDAIGEVSSITGASQSEIFSVITFYKQFRLLPPGRFLLKLCDGTACHVMGSMMLYDVVTDELKLESGDTTRDGLFTISPVACLGCCSLAPVIMVNEETFGGLTPQKVRKILRDYQRKGKAA
ncbi:MAG: NADH-quinone oxidoreductase subunit NuoE [Myxococcota bacterium]|jgi:NADH-quinone oxidoreductase subunit E